MMNQQANGGRGAANDVIPEGHRDRRRVMRYTVLLIPHPASPGYAVDVVSLPGCITQGDTEEEALAMAVDAAQGWIETAVESGWELPVEPPGTLIRQIEVIVPDTGSAHAGSE